MIETDVTVIGGGAAGLMAAITAAECGARTLVIEHMDRVGKKILATGNGKCNYTNALQGISYYRGEDPAFVLPVFEQFGFEETVEFFKRLGVYPKIKKGYYYPASEQAASVLDVLRMEADYREVNILTSCELKQLQTQKGNFFLLTNQGKIHAKTIIFATGLLASPKTGSDGSAIPYIEKLGHHLIDVVPALVQLQGKQAFFKTLAGIRAEVAMELYIEGQKKQAETGELQLTDYGVSGIPIFQLSRFATRALAQRKSVYVQIDFAPQLQEAELFRLLMERFYQYSHGKTALEALIGLFHKKLIQVLLEEARIETQMRAEDVSKKQLQNLCNKIKQFRVDIVGSKDFTSAQVCAGGVSTKEVEASTLESRLVPGVFFAGEVLDIDGTCGGYNLQWAWSSGRVAGIHAAMRASDMK